MAGNRLLPVLASANDSVAYDFGYSLPVGFTFTRTTVSGMHRSANGYGTTYGVDTPAFARKGPEYVTNLIVNSESFDKADWGKGQASVSVNVIADPNGGMTAAALIENTAASQFHYLSQVYTKPATATVYTGSIYVKDKGGRDIQLSVQDSGGSNGVVIRFRPSTGAFQTPSFPFGTGWTNLGAEVINVGNGWYRVTQSVLSSTATSVVLQVNLFNTDAVSSVYTGDGVSGVYLFGAQLENNNKARTYVPTYSTTNIVQQSQTLDNAGWQKLRTTISANATTAPDGTATADAIVEDSTASSTHLITQTSIPLLNTTQYTASFYAKADTRSKIFLSLSSGWAGNSDVTFDLSAGTATPASGSITATITAVGSGWYRCTGTSTTTGTAGNFNLYMHNGSTTTYTGDGVSKIYVWGCQLETGSVATTYVPTTAAVTSTSTDFANPSGATFNYQLQSQDFTAWGKSNSTVVANTVAAPDGSLTADKVVEGTGVNAQVFYNQTNWLASSVYTMSVYAKAAERGYIDLYFATAASALITVRFNLSTGASTIVAGTVTAASTSVGNGWYRCAVTFTTSTAPSGAVLVLIDNGSGFGYTGDGVSGVYLWGAQLELGKIASDYIPTTTAVAGSAPTPLGLSCVGGTTNLLLHSNDFTQATWDKSDITVTANATTFADGTATMDKLVETATTASHFLQKNSGTTITMGAHYCLSAFMKAGERTTSRIYALDTGLTNGFYADCDLVTGTVTASALVGTGTLDQFGVEDWGGGLYRFWVSGVVSAAATTVLTRIYVQDTVSRLGDNTKGIYVGGLQLEAGRIPLPYISTAGTQVSAGGEVTSATFVNIGYKYQTTGTIVAEYNNCGISNIGPSFSGFPVTLTDAGATNQIRILRADTTPLTSVQILNGGSAVVNSGVGIPRAYSKEKVALAWVNDNVNAAFNGILGTADTSCTIPTQPDRIWVGHLNSAQQIQGYMRKVTLYTDRKSDSLLPGLSL